MPEMTMGEMSILHAQNKRIAELEAERDEALAENQRLQEVLPPLYDYLTGNNKLSAQQLEQLGDKVLALLRDPSEYREGE